ncbi:Nuclear transport factor 2 [Sesamum angolense]|uniref:Nuclear transport factor 2 n=1 Tax=Sesamum angolense TaxID=2727404 RepID=A0AAE1XD28_9LAMI|nr:Nuclear transport factor 2 [Sesamum angolense]
MAAAAEVAAQQPVSAQVVGNAFVQQYYHILHHSPGLVYRFYQDIRTGCVLASLVVIRDTSKNRFLKVPLCQYVIAQAIDAKIVSLNYGDFRAEIKSVDAQESFNGGVNVLVTGYLTGKDNTVRNFAQSFFLAPQDRGYFVLNDMFRYLDNVNLNPALVNDVVQPAAPGPTAPAPGPAPVQEDHVSEESTQSTEEAVAGEVYNPPQNGDVAIVEEEVPVAEVVDEVQDDVEIVVESNPKTEELPKKSYASIVMHLKESAATFSPPPAAPRRAPPKNIEQANPTLAPATDGQFPVQTDGYSIYIKGLPMSATDTLLEEVFKKFGTIKSDGIQVRSNRQQGFCFGFVEFEEASAVQKALEASPVTIGGRQAFVEEKRGRFQSGRGSGFRNEGVRGRGNYGVGRGYNRGDFSGRSEFGNKGGNRGSSRDVYQRSENINSNGGRVSRTGGMANGSAKSMTPRVPATA